MTKKDLERELRIYKEMYKAAHQERMQYLYLLEEIAEGNEYCAMDSIQIIKDADYTFARWYEGKTINKLIAKIKRGV